MAEKEMLAAVIEALHAFIRSSSIGSLESWSGLLAGISHTDLAVLRLAGKRGDLMLKDIRLEFNIPQSTLTSVVDRLEGRGLLRRVISMRDRRSFGLELTEEGRRINVEHDRLDRLAGELIIDALGEEREVERFTRALDRISARFREAKV